MRIEVMLSEHGENSHMPMDHFDHMQTIPDWLIDKRYLDLEYPEFNNTYAFEGIMQNLESKIVLYREVYEVYRKIGNDDLRHQVYVATNIDPLKRVEIAGAGLYFYFIFKEDNNGETFIIRGEI